MKRPPFLDPRELESLRSQIAASGFERDPLVAEHADRACIGLNLAVAWPLPSPIDAAYGAFEARTRALEPTLYVYPHPTTHVTVLTAVTFKRHPEPTVDVVRAVDEAAAALGDFTAEALVGVAPFDLDVGAPVLARAAAFLPMKNASGEIGELRRRTLAFCLATGGLLAEASAPSAVHSTVLRFRQTPADPLAFARAFDVIAEDFPTARMTIEEILVTLETKPYMRAGKIVRRISLLAGAESAPTR